MKYLHVPALAWITAYLQECTVGTEIWEGQVEAFSCKAAGEDKKLQKRLMRQFSQDSEERDAYYREHSGEDKAPPVVVGPLGPIDSTQTHKMLVYLIQCLNATYAIDGYDFSTLRATNFEKLTSYRVGIAEIDRRIRKIETVNHDTSFRTKLWKAIDEAIDMKRCDVYRYIPDLAGDPLSSKGGVPTLWSLNYFFYNSERKRIVYVTCKAFHGASIERAHEIPRSPSPLPPFFPPTAAAETAVVRPPVARDEEEEEEEEITIKEHNHPTVSDDSGEIETASSEKTTTTPQKCETEPIDKKSWTHEIATCEKSYEGQWNGDWESCRVLKQKATAYDVQCKKDGKIVTDVPENLVRSRKRKRTVD